jgi:maltooligosyltrehalose trehalohydrolase
MLFMGEEYGETRPWQFFTDHIDPFIADATREGRRHEFAAFAGFEDEVPDPQARETFERSVLDPAAGDPHLRELYRALLAMRRDLPSDAPVVRSDEAARWIAMERGDVTVVGNFGRHEAEVAVTATTLVLPTREDVVLREGRLTLPPLSGAVVR